MDRAACKLFTSLVILCRGFVLNRAISLLSSFCFLMYSLNVLTSLTISGGTGSSLMSTLVSWADTGLLGMDSGGAADVVVLTVVEVSPDSPVRPVAGADVVVVLGAELKLKLNDFDAVVVFAVDDVLKENILSSGALLLIAK